LVSVDSTTTDAALAQRASPPSRGRHALAPVGVGPRGCRSAPRRSRAPPAAAVRHRPRRGRPHSAQRRVAHQPLGAFPCRAGVDVHRERGSSSSPGIASPSSGASREWRGAK
jgi:hypothetical protein